MTSKIHLQEFASYKCSANNFLTCHGIRSFSTPPTCYEDKNKSDCILSGRGGIDGVQRLLHNIQNEIWNKKNDFSQDTEDWAFSFSIVSESRKTKIH